MKEKFAKILRVLTIPPLLILFMIMFLKWKTDIFSSMTEMLSVLLFLAVIPALAYALQPIVPGFRHKGRSGQRTLAIILSCVGYTAGVITGYAMRMSNEVKLIFNTYFLSVVVLVALNCFHVRASGHACSVAGPLIFLVFYGHYFMILPCVLIAVAVVWSSLWLKRHTVKELMLGFTVSTVSFFFVNWLL